jgi:molybdate transport system ATP-binding protein
MTWRLKLNLNLDHFSLDIDIESTAQSMAFIGLNGSGKSTLLKAIAGAYPHLKGVIEVGAQTLFDSSSGIDVPIEARGLGYVPQSNSLLPHLTVVENLCFGAVPEHMSNAQMQKAAFDWLEELGCPNLAQMRGSTLSTGQRQKIALARVLMRRPQALLLDEPLSNIDLVTRQQLRRLLQRHLNEHDTPSLIMTHDHRDALNVAQAVCVLENGKVIQMDTPKAVAANPVNLFTEAFFDGVTLPSA